MPRKAIFRRNVSLNIRPTFVFLHGVEKQSWHLVFNEQFLADREEYHRGVAEHFVESKVISKVLKNPGKRIQISKFDGSTIEEKVSRWFRYTAA